VSECPKCGKLIKSGETLCSDCKNSTNPGLKIGVDTIPDDESQHAEGLEHAELDPEKDPRDQDQNHSANPLNKIDQNQQNLTENEEESDQRLELEEDLIKVQESPFDDFLEPQKELMENDDKPLNQTPISDEIEPDPESDRNILEHEDIPFSTPPQNNSDDSADVSSDRLYVMPDNTISSSDREKLISNLQSKIPGIIRQKQADSEEEKTTLSVLPDDEEFRQEKDKYSPESDNSSEESKTNIYSAPFSPPPKKSEKLTIFARGSKAFFPAGTKLKAGTEVTYAGRTYSVAGKKANIKDIALTAAAGLIPIILLAVGISGIFAPSQPGKVIGLVLNSETMSVVPSAEVMMNELDRIIQTDEKGMFIFEGLDGGNWSLVASKPQFRTASLGFNLPDGGTSVVTLYMKPVVSAGLDDNDEGKAAKKEKQKTVKTPLFGKLHVNTNVPDARVIVDNKVLGPGNKTYSRLYEGEHKLVVMKEGYKEFSGNFKVEHDKTTTLDIDLEEIEIAYNPSEITYDQYLAKANDLASKENWQEAVGNYTMALAKKTDPEIYHGRAAAYLNLGQKNQAQADFLKASQAYVKGGQTSRAVECLNEILKLSPDHTRALRARGLILLRTGEYKKALEDLRRAEEINEDSFDNQIALGEALYIMGDYKESLKHFKKARKLDETNARVYALSALASMARGKDKDARKYYKGFEIRASAADINEFSSNPEWQRLTQMVYEEED